MGIVNTDDYQIVFSDTPGVLTPKFKLQQSMLEYSTGALVDADVLLYVTDVVESPTKNQAFLDKVAREKVPIILVINKIDLLSGQDELVKIVDQWRALLPQAEIYPTSAKENFNVDQIKKRIVELLPVSPPYFGKDALTDRSARFDRNRARKNSPHLRQGGALRHPSDCGKIHRIRHRNSYHGCDICGARHPKGHHHRQGRKKTQARGHGSQKRFGEVFRQARVSAALCEGGIGLEKSRKETQSIWLH